MCWRTALSSGLLLVYFQVFSVPLRAQTDKSQAPCTSSSAKAVRASLEPGGNHPKVIIDDVRFDAPIHLPESVVDQAIAEANDFEMDATNSEWLNEFVEAGIRSAWQDRGYFRVTVGRAEAELLGGDSHAQHFRVLVPFNEGLQYHLGDLNFVNATAFSSGDLRGLIPLRGGEMFDVSKIRAGIEALNKKYAAIGYIDFTAVPKTEIDDKLQRISLTLELDEEKQYRIGEVNVTGLDPVAETRLRSGLVSGAYFNPQAIDDFMKQNRASLPMNLRKEDYLEAKRNTRLGIVDLSFDFRALASHDCSEAIR
jgi:outer membrane translocation and assembly module TamA